MTLVIYVASPYSSPNPATIHERYVQVRNYTVHLFNRGLFPYSPIVHCHDLAKVKSMPIDFEFWRDYNFAMLKRMDCLYVLQLPGWDASVGVTNEIQYAREIGLPVTYAYETSDGYHHTKRATR